MRLQVSEYCDGSVNLTFPGIVIVRAYRILTAAHGYFRHPVAAHHLAVPGRMGGGRSTATAVLGLFPPPPCGKEGVADDTTLLETIGRTKF